MAKYNHKRFYSKPEQRKIIPRYEITNGMIINFRYKGSNYDKRPLVFVMDTDEFVKQKEKKFSGINLNYLPIGDVNKFFMRVLTKTGWEYSKITKMPKVDIWDEENPGLRPKILYESVVKKSLLNRRDCWRTYKYHKCSGIEQINFKFNTYPLTKLLESQEVKKITKEAFKKGLTESRYGKKQVTTGDTIKREQTDEN